MRNRAANLANWRSSKNAQWDGLIQCALCLDKLGWGSKLKARQLGVKFLALYLQLKKRGLNQPKGTRKGVRLKGSLIPLAAKSRGIAEFRQAVKRIRREQSGMRMLFPKPKHSSAMRSYYRNHSESKRKGANKARAMYARRKHDPVFKIAKMFRNMVARILRVYKTKKGKRTIEYLGCSVKAARIHIERQFKRGMTWENHGAVWEIDHIIPLAKFDFSDPTQVLMANHWSNLRPLDKAKNRAKSDKLERHETLPLLLQLQ